MTLKYEAVSAGRSKSHFSGIMVLLSREVIEGATRGGVTTLPAFPNVYEDNMDKPTLRHAGTPTTLPTIGDDATYYHRNQQYSIVALTNAGGTLVERYTYSAYGTLGIYDPAGTVRSVSTYGNRYTYTGREWDPGLNLYHFRARWYDPTTGGFISRDPLGYVDGMSLYRGYMATRYLDPFGTELWYNPRTSEYKDLPPTTSPEIIRIYEQQGWIRHGAPTQVPVNNPVFQRFLNTQHTESDEEKRRRLQQLYEGKTQVGCHRELTDNERKLLQKLFKGRLNCEAIKIYHGYFWDATLIREPVAFYHWASGEKSRPMVPFGTACFPQHRWQEDYVGTDDEPTFVHEMTHVLQVQQGLFMPWRKLTASIGVGFGFWGDSYYVDPDDIGRYRLRDFNIEQQAVIMQRYHMGFYNPFLHRAEFTIGNLETCRPWEQIIKDCELRTPYPLIHP